MKQFYLKQKVFSLTDKYKVYDENQKVVFHCEGRLLSLSHRMDFHRTADDKHLFTITRKVLSLLPVYHLTTPEGTAVATIRKRFTLLSHKLDIESTFGTYQIEGDFSAHYFTVAKGNAPVVEFRKKWLSWGDSYEIVVHDDANAEFFVALVVMIDDCLHDQDGRSGVAVHFGSGH